MTYRFQFDAKRGDLAGASTAAAFIKTLDPNAGFALTNFLTVDTTSLPSKWRTYTIDIAVDASLAGQILQFGFLNTASNFEPSGVFYDNVSFQPPPPCETQKPTRGCRVNGRLGPCVGTPGSDVIFGTPGKDVIDGRGGDDYIHGFEKKDLLCGGGGDDVLIGGDGRDSLFGENGDDILEGLRGRDTLDGGPGNDKLDGGGGNDSCIDPNDGNQTYPFQSCEITP